MEKFLLSDISGYIYKEAGFEKALVCFGSTENHGDHLPFGTDSLVSYEIAKAVAQKVEKTMVLPVLPFGMSEHYHDFPIAISLQAETLINVIRDILLSLLKHRIHKVLVINGHDGNIAPIEIATRQVKVAHPEMKIAVLNAWWVSAGKLLPAGTFETWDGLGHAGEGETSMVLALRKDLVHITKNKAVLPNLPSEVEIKWVFTELTSRGFTGDPASATVEKGQKIKEVLVKHLVDFIEKMDKTNWQIGKKRGSDLDIEV